MELPRIYLVLNNVSRLLKWAYFYRVKKIFNCLTMEKQNKTHLLTNMPIVYGIYLSQKVRCQKELRPILKPKEMFWCTLTWHLPFLTPRCLSFCLPKVNKYPHTKYTVVHIIGQVLFCAGNQGHQKNWVLSMVLDKYMTDLNKDELFFLEFSNLGQDV